MEIHSLFTILCIIQFLSKDQTWGCNPLPLLRERKIIIFFLLRYLDEECIPLGREASHQKVNTSPQLSVCLKGSSFFSNGSVGPLSCCFVWVFSSLWRPIIGPACCLSEVCFQSRKKPDAACVTVHSVCLTANSHYTSSIHSLATLFYFSGNFHHTAEGTWQDKTTGLLVVSGTSEKWNLGRLENGSLISATKCCGWRRH